MRQLACGSIVLVLVTFGWGAHSWGQEVPVPRGELRIVNKNAGNWWFITFIIFQHLIEVDKDGQLVPRLGTGWRWLDDRTLDVTLRQGVTFHNGEVFDAEIVKLNWDENTRVRQPHMTGEYMNFQPGSRLEILDPHTVRFLFPEPDGGALAKILNMHIANRQFYRELGWGEASW
jgi:ABC-type transport system substrate-binding protein